MTNFLVNALRPFLEASQECKDLLSQLGNGLEVNAAAPSRLDFWTPLETDGNCNLDSAFVSSKDVADQIKFNSEEVIFQVLLDPDCWLNNGSATIEVEKDADLRSLRKKDCCLLQRRAIALHQKTGVPQGPCGFEKIALFEQYLKIQVIVVSTTALNQVCYKGPVREDRRIYLWHHDNYFDVITSPKGFYGSNFFCEECFKPFDHIENHHCTMICHVCRSPSCQIGESKQCSDCDRNTRSDFCFKVHKENGLWKCCKVILRKVCSKSQHRCEEKEMPQLQEDCLRKPYVLPSERICEEVQRKTYILRF
ncbi:uncharacterized protein TNCV_4904401 [Trichonephila clavipes]|nr:uncharacterized protein TNCV_4904401 [Trichonephila clavipes]